MQLTKELLEHITSEVGKAGFSASEYGFRRGQSQNVVKIDEGTIFIRKTPLSYCFSSSFYSFFGKNCEGGVSKPLENNGFRMGAKSSMGSPKLEFAPTPKKDILAQINEPVLAVIPSLRELRSENDSLLIGFDAEWYDEPRKILSLQFSVVKDDILYEYICLNHGADGSPFLRLETILSKILNDLGFQSYDKYKYRKYRACVGFNADGLPVWKNFDSEKELYPYAHEIYPLFPDDPTKPVNLQRFEPANKTIAELHEEGTINRFAKRGNRVWKWAHSVSKFPERHNVTVVCHAGRVDLSTLLKDGERNWLNYTSPIQGGAVSLRSIVFNVNDLSVNNLDNHDIFPVSLNFRDTMAQAPAGYKSLAKLGDAIGLRKLDDAGIMKNRMNDTLAVNPAGFFNYSARDATITVLYSSFIYGINKEMPVTLTSAGAFVIAQKLKEYMNLKTKEDFDLHWRGVKKVLKGTVKNPNGIGYLTASNKEPISEKARDVQNAAGLAYHGGLNASTLVGYINEPTVDFDLCSAYPTALARVRDINWQNPIKQEFTDLTLRSDSDRANFLEKFRDPRLPGGFDPMLPLFARVKFRFPNGTKFPCLPINNEGRIVCPLAFGSGYGLDHEDVVYVAGPELYLALKMGAEIFIERGYLLNTLYREDGSDSLSMGAALKSLIQERSLAKKHFKDTKLWELILKNVANGSAYGKTAQNVVDKRSWNTYTHVMDDLTESVITNPVTASLATSFVRAELFAIMTQLANLGYKVYSVTTDGFISNCLDVDVLESLDMFGLAGVARISRLFLTDGADGTIWEAKHKQDAFYNATTRGNMALNLGGVCAHNSTKTPFESGSLEDRHASMLAWLSRVGRVSYRDTKWTTHKEIALGANFSVRDVVREVSMDFDMKRKPIRDSFYTENVEFAGVVYEVACFDTEPFETITEANLYEQKKKLCAVLRTEDDWAVFWMKIEYNGISNHITKRGIEWNKLTSCVMGARHDFWTIPTLDRTDLTVKDKLEWLNSFGFTDYKFNENNWKDARKKDRLVNMLPYELIADYLEILGATNIKILQK